MVEAVERHRTVASRRNRPAVEALPSSSSLLHPAEGTEAVRDLMSPAEEAPLFSLLRQYDTHSFDRSDHFPPPKRQRTPAAEVLPFDVVTEILSRLPPKSLLRFRSVCKAWRDLISDPYFTDLHLEHAKRNPVITLFPLDLKINNLYPYDNEEEHHHHEISDFLFERGFNRECKVKLPILHCNGMLLVMTLYQIYVCNPCTRDFEALPFGSMNVLPLERYTENVGFVFDPSTKQYKVIRHFCRSCDEQTNTCSSLGCEIFTLGTRSWRAVAEDPPYPILAHSSAFVNGTVYWMIDNEVHSSSPKGILSFNLRDETFGVISPPPNCSSHLYQDSLLSAGMGGNLHFSVVQEDKQVIDSWVLKDCTKHVWTLEYSAKLLQFPNFVKPVGIHHQMLWFQAGETLCYIDPETKMVVESELDIEKHLDYCNPRQRKYHCFSKGVWCFRSTSFVKSLVFVGPKKSRWDLKVYP